ncbi:tRNA (adenosine(37)-N6)-threonylcarbamoyltransferase complex transferase subunit TsaD [Candidatus Parcubacteria bacterium]|nr:MAG: tRNA (adenosine(37)-N6)-threonylcarbamoyltransferase complex transferase subunit TsaD [Candidatus Parcubacteria bacterium]
MKILGIESSCDDTSVALIDITGNKINILAEKTASQIEIHKKYGGVVPEIAGRKHAEQITPVVEEIMKDFEKPDIIAVTSGPGLITGLIVGVETAKTLSYLWDIPIVGMNHIEGHIHSVLIENEKEGRKRNINFPVLSLVVSGGHTEIILSKEQGRYKKVGGTRDDAAGECFDKVAKLLEFDYPGGPKISKFAEAGNPKAIDFPRPMIHSKDFDMSFSGLKTAALYHLRDHPNTDKNDFCASFEQAIVDLLVSKTLKATKKYNPKTIILAGGVSANKKLRNTLEKEIKKVSPQPTFTFPLLPYCMDNATMIAVAAYNHAKNKKFTAWNKIQADPSWKIYNNFR